MNERIFQLEVYEFIGKMKEILPEMIEEKYCVINKEPQPKEAEFSTAISILSMIFLYVKQLQPQHITTYKMARVLQNIMANQEVSYLCEYANISMRQKLPKKIRKGECKKDIFLASQLLEYYLITFGKSCSEEHFSEFVSCIQMIEFMYEHAEKNEEAYKADRNFPIRLKAHLDEYVVGHMDVKKELSMSVYVKKELSMSVYHYLIQGKCPPILILGDTGTGKNHIMSTLSQYEGLERVPMITFDLTEVTTNGFVGESKNSIIKALKNKADNMGVGTDKGIIYLDEATKIMIPSWDSSGENVNRTIQYQLLSLLSGTEIEGIDTANLFFVLGGASEELLSLRESRRNNRKLGFLSNTDMNSERKMNQVDVLHNYGLQKLTYEKNLDFLVLLFIEGDEIGILQAKSLLGKVGDSLTDIKRIPIATVKKHADDAIRIPAYVEYFLNMKKDISQICSQKVMILLARNELIQKSKDINMWFYLLFSKHDFENSMEEILDGNRSDSAKICVLHKKMKEQYLALLDHKVKYKKNAALVVEKESRKKYPRVYVQMKKQQVTLNKLEISDIISIEIKLKGKQQYSNMTDILVWIYMFYLYPIKMERISHEDIEKVGGKDYDGNDKSWE